MSEQPERRGRGPGKRPSRIHVTLRIPQYVLDYYDGDKLKMRDAWVEYVDKLVEFMQIDVGEIKGEPDTGLSQEDYEAIYGWGGQDWN